MTQPLTFDPQFGKLGREIERFANHTRKLLQASLKNRELLEAASAWSEGTAPLDRAPDDVKAAMTAMDKFARLRRERRPKVFGAYFAHHYLRTQAMFSRELLRASFNPDRKHRIATCHRVYKEQEQTRREWVSNLLTLTISEATPELSRNDYVALNVGALVDHEDVDLAIVVKNEQARDAISGSLAQVSKVFVRHASKVQLFLTEELETPRVAAMIDEYAELNKRPGESVVSVMQLLGSQYLSGNKSLAKALDERVIRAYYAGEGQPMVHEAFLRSVMAELKHYRAPNTKPGVLSPKREIYVPSKLAITAVRVIHGVHEARPPMALKKIARKDPALRETYLALSDAFVQNEVLRALMFLYISHGDAFDMSDPDVVNSARRVALLMGARSSAKRSETGRLVGVYTEIRARALRAVAVLCQKIEDHLQKVSTFRRVVENEYEVQKENLAERLLEQFEHARGGVFWDEVVELLSDNAEHGARFIADFSRLSAGRREELALKWVSLMSESASSMVEFLVYVARQEMQTARPVNQGAPLAMEFWAALMSVLNTSTEAFDKFIAGLDTETSSEALHRLAIAYPPRALAELADLLEQKESTRTMRVVRTLRSVIILVHHRSNWVGRIAGRVMARTPAFVTSLGDARGLKELASSIQSEAAREHRPREQVELLGDSFDVATLRASLIAILDGVPPALDIDYTSAVDRYVRELFKACFREVRQRSPMFTHYRPGAQIAVYATGGYGRSEAFGADWDYLAVVDKDDRGLKKFFGKVLQRLSAALSRRGLHPHNRFASHFNSYVVSLEELWAHLSDRGTETFIDEAEVLESRFILGDPATARRFNDEIRGQVLGKNAHLFMKDLLAELGARRGDQPRELNLKEAPGGLRELHLLWLILRVFGKLPGPFNLEMLPELAEQLPNTRSHLRIAMLAQAELRRTRDLYRLLEAFDDQVEPEALVRTAKDLAPLARIGIRESLAGELEKLLATSAGRIDAVAAEVRDQLSKSS